MKALTLILLTLAGSAWAEPIPYRQSLFKHGLEASAYGEAVLQRDAIRDTDLLSGRVQGGWLLSRHSFLATTVGASYGGLLGNAQKEEAGVVEYRTYGPVLEAIAFPDSFLTPILSYSYAQGFFKRSANKEALDYDYSTLKMQELRLTLALQVGKYQQLILGASGQDIRFNNFYKQDKDGDYYRRRGQTQERSRSYFAGLRLAAF